MLLLFIATHLAMMLDVNTEENKLEGKMLCFHLLNEKAKFIDLALQLTGYKIGN